MDSNIFVCRQCGRPYLVESTGNHEEWRIAPYYPEIVTRMEAQPPIIQQAIDYALTGEFMPEYKPTQSVVGWTISATAPFRPDPKCLGELETSFIAQWPMLN